MHPNFSFLVPIIKIDCCRHLNTQKKRKFSQMESVSMTQAESPLGHLSDNHRVRVRKRLGSKYPDRVPVLLRWRFTVVTPRKLPRKLMVPGELTGHHMLARYRQIWNELISVSNGGSDGAHMPPPSLVLIDTFTGKPVNTGATLEELAQQYAHSDGFLYLTIANDSAFGAHLLIIG